MFRVIVAGSRGFNDLPYLSKILGIAFEDKKPTSIVCGEANGADRLGKIWAIKHGIPVDSFPANWSRYGKSAGFKRNAEMADNADAVVVFWDGSSPGTRHMINIAVEKKLPVIVCNYKTKKIFKIG